MKKTKEMYGDDKIYRSLMSIGRISGCHQLPERSFFARSKQFPVCARCTGVLFGNIIAVTLIFTLSPYWPWFVFGCAVMFMDWFFQYIGILESTNVRRLITGIIGGYSLTSLYFVGISFVAKLFLS